MLILAATASTGLSLVLAKRPLSRHSVLQMTAIINGLGFTTLLPVGAVPIARQPWKEMSTAAWLGLGYGALISHTVGLALWYNGGAELGPTRTVAYSYLIPVVAVGMAVLTRGERFTTVQGVGAVVIFAGITLSHLAPRKATTGLTEHAKVTKKLHEEKGYGCKQGRFDHSERDTAITVKDCGERGPAVLRASGQFLR